MYAAGSSSRCSTPSHWPKTAASSDTVTFSSRLSSSSLTRHARRPVHSYMVNVSFDEFKEEGLRRYYKLLPTSFVLTSDEVDSLREAGRLLLRNSPEYQDLLKRMSE